MLIRAIEIENFRGVKALKWQPREGINCLVGAGDSGKSTVLDAIDYCIGARRTLQIADSDFCGIDIEKPVRICVTLGALPDELKSIEGYGLYLRGFDAATGDIASEPEANLETVLTVQLLVESDLEPQWSLVSARAAAQGHSRSLNWADRVKLSPTRLGAINDNNLTWRRGSLLNRISDERADASKELAQAAREARAAFIAQGTAQVAEALAIVTRVAQGLGIPVGAEVKALLASHKDSIRTVGSDADVIDAVASTPGAIGFIEEHSITDRVVVVKVDGKLPMEAGYLPH